MRDWKKLLCGTFLFAAFSGLAHGELINEFIPGGREFPRAPLPGYLLGMLWRVSMRPLLPRIPL